MTDSTRGFSVARSHADVGEIVHFRGELDASSAPKARAVLSDVVKESPRVAVVDMSGLTFADASILSILVLARVLAQEAGGELRLASVPTQVKRLLSLTRLERTFPIFDSVDDAISGGRR